MYIQIRLCECTCDWCNGVKTNQKLHLSSSPPPQGRLWIHAAGKVPEPETIKAMEDFYREIYATEGITDIKFPEHYPVSRLIGIILMYDFYICFLTLCLY